MHRLVYLGGFATAEQAALCFARAQRPGLGTSGAGCLAPLARASHGASEWETASAEAPKEASAVGGDGGGRGGAAAGGGGGSDAGPLAADQRGLPQRAHAPLRGGVS